MKNLRKLLSCSLICLIGIAVFSVPNVHAASVQITKVEYPPTITYGSSDVVHISVNVAYKAANLIGQSGNGDLAVSIDSNDEYISGTDVVVTCSSNQCVQGQANTTGLPLSVGAIYHLPAANGGETFDFTFLSTHAPALPLWQLSAWTILFTNQNENGNSINIYNFTIPVVGIPSSSTNSTQITTHASTIPVTVTTSATSPLQMPQPPQETATQSTNNAPQLVLGLAVIAAIVFGALFLYSRRKRQPTLTQAEKVDTAVAPLSTKTSEGKRFCIECGNELAPNLMFCDSCGTKQP